MFSKKIRSETSGGGGVFEPRTIQNAFFLEKKRPLALESSPHAHARSTDSPGWRPAIEAGAARLRVGVGVIARLEPRLSRGSASSSLRGAARRVAPRRACPAVPQRVRGRVGGGRHGRRRGGNPRPHRALLLVRPTRVSRAAPLRGAAPHAQGMDRRPSRLATGREGLPGASSTLPPVLRNRCALDADPVLRNRRARAVAASVPCRAPGGRAVFAD